MKRDEKIRKKKEKEEDKKEDEESKEASRRLRVAESGKVKETPAL